MLTRRRCLATLLAGAAAGGLAAPPQQLPSPQGDVVLSISGEVARTNAPARADFDFDMLAGLPQHDIHTHTPWHAGKQTFSGPLLRDVIGWAGAHGSLLQAFALNDYSCEIPAQDAADFDVIIALLQNGARMRVRDKGPLFIVYPFDSDSRLRSDRYYARSAWQLRRLVVKA